MSTNIRKSSIELKRKNLGSQTTTLAIQFHTDGIKMSLNAPQFVRKRVYSAVSEYYKPLYVHWKFKSKVLLWELIVNLSLSSMLNVTIAVIESLQSVNYTLVGSASSGNTIQPFLSMWFQPLKSLSSPNELSNDFKKMIGDKPSSDLILVVEGKDVHVHKFPLISRSSYFRAMFQYGWKEEGQKKLVIKDVKHDSFLKVIEFLYTDNIEEIENRDKANELIKLADMFGLTRLVEIVQQKLVLNFDEYNKNYAGIVNKNNETSDDIFSSSDNVNASRTKSANSSPLIGGRNNQTPNNKTPDKDGASKDTHNPL